MTLFQTCILKTILFSYRLGRLKNGYGARLDYSHRELDSDMFEIHLAAMADTPDR